MKKMIFLCIILSMFLCACSTGGDGVMLDADAKKANKQFEKVIEALESKDTAMLTSLFSLNSIQTLDNFDESIEQIMNYYVGEKVSYNKDGGAALVESSVEDGEYIQTMQSTYDLYTTKGAYRVAIKSVSKDTVDPNNIGIHSLYIIKMSDDTYPEYAYWGDALFTPGINIGIPNIK
jgi:hypothetical protein